MRKGLQCVARGLDLMQCIGLLCGSAPNTRDVYFITGLPQNKCRIARPYTAHSPTQITMITLRFAGAFSTAVVIAAIAASLSSGRNRSVWKCAIDLHSALFRPLTWVWAGT